MPDIAMCVDEACPSRSSCYRFLATPSRIQAVGWFLRKPDASRCDHYWPATNGAVVKNLDERPETDG